MNLLFTVCGRAGSKGIKGKNFRDFLGYPLLYYTLSAIELYKNKHTEHLVHIALNTDSEEMVSLVKKGTNLDVTFIPRKEELAGDNIAKMPVISDTLREMELLLGSSYDCVVDLDITSPLRTVNDIERLVTRSLESDFDVIFSVTESRRNPYFNMVKENENGSVSRNSSAVSKII